MGLINSFRALFELDQEVDWVYERLAVFQSLGWIFKLRGKKWILETNAPLSVESKSDRKTILLNPLATYLEYQAYKNCDVLVCVSETLKNIIIEQTGIPPQKAIVVPNGVDVSIFNPSLYKPLRMFNEFTIGFIGNFASWQGLELLLGAIHEIREQGVIINLTLVGDGPERIDLENITRNLRLSDIVKYVGFVPQNKVPEYILGFDIGYSGQTERTEQRMYCSPIKIYEYMAMGKPVIASDYEDTRKVINPSNGFLFEIGNQEDLINKILQAYNGKADLIKMGSKAREEIVQNHSWESRISFLIAKINEIENS
jgi:glycosyltransferase involved in cell wall biosynthesis